jgi:hypothetical protein
MQMLPAYLKAFEFSKSWTDLPGVDEVQSNRNWFDGRGLKA